MYGLPLSNEKASLLLQGEDLHPHLNEALLLHGTKRENLAGILAEGFRLDPTTVGGSSGTAFGDGIYLCDKPLTFAKGGGRDRFFGKQSSDYVITGNPTFMQ